MALACMANDFSHISDPNGSVCCESDTSAPISSFRRSAMILSRKKKKKNGSGKREVEAY
jgi:hypothetical protein